METFIKDISGGTSSIKAYIQISKQNDISKYVLLAFKSLTNYPNSHAEIDVVSVSSAFNWGDDFYDDDLCN